MTPKEKVETYFQFAAKVWPDRDLFDQIIHSDILVTDPPIGAEVRGKENLWQALNVSPDSKEGPGTMNLKSEFVGFYGSEDEGYARWNWHVGGACAAWYGMDVAEDAPYDDPIINEVFIHIKFKDGKISYIREQWDALPVVRRFGANVPTPKQPQ